ncbi:MAG: urease accessory protein UreE [Planktotalea sp.]|uniref:urease accessory protein UreE n=1 Tax=Planktotalea sp. TaxID=2029877 RepID=UPI0002DCC22F|nr:urease accessory protein UreE [Planktotalea sp.]MBT5822813.1 urease accessory protein UreE [Paracoccaceae bacterium]MDG1076046.1 urease accessory protein UreE [Planktotalea sp.]MDG1084681.1 urease accessory protein UreE [Planktotalea sp.]HCW83143.1 urease accessory protein UreE [Paracoccaceae bacterium]
MTVEIMATCQTVRHHGHWSGAMDHVALSYDERFLRRKVLTTAEGRAVLVDLSKTTSLDHGDALEMEDGSFVEVRAAQEELLEIRGGDLTRLAWHIGNRHTPCQIEGSKLVIQRNHVMQDMLHKLGASVTEISAPFTPEGGAYGNGRTLGHSH